MPFHSRPSASLSVFAGALAALSLAACGQASDGVGEGEPVGESASALSANDKTAFDYFLGKGLTPVQAAGIVGNLDQESSMNPAAVQPGGPGRGIAQWSVGGRWDHDSGDNAVAYAASHGKSVGSFGLQLDFIWFELTTFSSYGLSSLKKSTTVSAATLAFMQDFEACGTCLSSQRISYAQSALTAYGNDHVDAGTDASTPKKDAGGTDGGKGAEGEDGGVAATGGSSGSSASAEDGDAGGTSATHETTSAETQANAIGDDQGGCSIARGEKSTSRGGVDQMWLASVCAALVFALRRRRQRED
jgi:hypothetical protein